MATLPQFGGKELRQPQTHKQQSVDPFRQALGRLVRLALHDSHQSQVTPCSVCRVAVKIASHHVRVLDQARVRYARSRFAGAVVIGLRHSVYKLGETDFRIPTQ